jgi:hypothetical protein
MGHKNDHMLYPLTSGSRTSKSDIFSTAWS